MPRARLLTMNEWSDTEGRYCNVFACDVNVECVITVMCRSHDMLYQTMTV